MTQHLGHERHGPPASDAGNIRKGTRPKTVLRREICKDSIWRITDKGTEEMQGLSSRSPQGVYAATFIDVIFVKVRDGQVGNQPFYAAIGVDLNGRGDMLGLWVGQGGGK